MSAGLALKPNWPESRERFRNWWNRKGLVIGSAVPLWRDGIQRPQPMPDEHKYLDPKNAVDYIESLLNAQEFPEDVIPVADTDIGPGSFCIYLGARPESTGSTVWFHSPFQSKTDIPDIAFSQQNIWWKRTTELFTLLRERLNGQALIGTPDLVENFDILASLRGSENLLMDFIDSPEWVRNKLRQIDSAWFDMYAAFEPLLTHADGSTAFHAFRLWGEGRTVKIQCDGSASFSADMFREFVLPGLREQCRRFDHSLYHLDGTDCIRHLDAVLEIDELDAVEWTPQAGIEDGTHPRWYSLYEKILDKGKSLQIIVGDADNANDANDATMVDDLLKATGRDGVYLLSVLEPDDFYRMAETARGGA